MNVSQQFQIELGLRLVGLPLLILWVLHHAHRKAQTRPIAPTLSAVLCAVLVAGVLGTPALRAGIHTEDLSIACLLAPFAMPNSHSSRRRLLGALGIVCVLVTWLIWPRLSPGVSLAHHVSLTHFALWVSAVIALWASCHEMWQERARFVMIGCMLLLTIAAALQAGSARTAQAAGALGMVCAGAGVMSLRNGESRSWSLHVPMSVIVVGLLLYQTEYGDVPQTSALLMLSLPIIGIAITLCGLTFGRIATLTTGLTLAALPAILAGSAKDPPVIYSTDGQDSDDGFSAPPEAKSQFESGYE